MGGLHEERFSGRNGTSYEEEGENKSTTSVIANFTPDCREKEESKKNN